MSRLKRRKGVDSETTNVIKRPRTRRSSYLEAESNSRSSSVSLHGSRVGTNSTPVSVVNVSRSATSSSTGDKYIVQEDEVIENQDLCDLLDESEPDPDDKKTLPVRILSYFEIYDYETQERKVLPMDIDPDEDVVFYGASGLVRPQVEEDEDDWNPDTQDDESVPVKLSAIQDVWTDKHEIWIRTVYAWYVLEYPSMSYRKYHEKMKVLAQNYVARDAAQPSRTQKSSAPSITPRVAKIAQGLFLRSLMMVNECVVSDPYLQNVCVPDIPFVSHEAIPTEIAWGEEIPGAKGFYKSVFVDGVEYHIHDTVAVTAPEASSSEDDGDSKLSNTAWFAQICYFFDRMESKRAKPEKYFHLRWFSHGSRTVLGETANPQALFLLDECDDNPVESVLQKITVQHLGPDDLEPVVISDDDVGSSRFHLSHKWDEQNMTMSAVDFEAETTALNNDCTFAEQPVHRQCYACAVREQRELQQTCNKLVPGVLEIYGNQYHLNDFVYVRISKKQTLLAIAQIVDLLPHSENSYLQVAIFDRASPASEKEQSPKMQRSLLHTGRVNRISSDSLDGHCFVLRSSDIDDLDAWLDGPDNFVLLHHSKPLEQCKQCVETREIQLKCESLVKKGPLLRAMDLFAGAGGLTTGMDSSGYIKTCWAVERCPSASKSLRSNHEDMIVYNQDCNVLLKHAVEVQEGKNPPAVRSFGSEKEILPPLPSPGEVDVIMGGPPCQPFSGMNRFKRVDDIRQTCIPTMLSYVEFYRPQYVLIENVTGLLHYRLNGRQEGRRIIGGVEAGMVKFIKRTLTSLGYQCQMRVLNSADYGSPQQRNRVIFWAARLGLILPKWPTPTHIPRKGHNSVIRRIANIYFAPVASRNGFEDGHQHAPFYAVTVNEAIDDLPSWDWENPGVLYPRGAKVPKSGRVTFPADTAQWRSDSEDAALTSGYNYPVLYATPPRFLYQRGLRKGQSSFARVDYHYTGLFSTGVVERTVNVPVRPLANFKDLPRPLQETGRKKKRVSANDTYWRLDGDSQFRTMMTVVNPAAKGAFVIHPTDKRVLTVREQARAQGFPDWYEFCSVEERKSLEIKDMERQIGNAVPVHLACALGRALGEGLVEAEIKRRQDQEDKISLDEWDARTGVSEEL